MSLPAVPVPRDALAARYAAIWDDAAPAVRAGDVALDPWAARKHADERRGLTLLARPAPELRQRLHDALGALREAEPEQYFQPPSDIHLTVLSPFSATTEHAPHVARLPDYQAAVAEALAEVPAFAVDIEGITLSAGAVLAQGFPRDGTLEHARDRLRAALDARGVGGGVDQRYRLVTAHLTLVRFAAPLRRPAHFVDLLASARRQVFGTMEIDRLELVMSDFYQTAGRTETVGTYPLHPLS